MQAMQGESLKVLTPHRSHHTSGLGIHTLGVVVPSGNVCCTQIRSCVSAVGTTASAIAAGDGPTKISAISTTLKVRHMVIVLVFDRLVDGVVGSRANSPGTRSRTQTRGGEFSFRGVAVMQRDELMSTWPAMVRVCQGVLRNREDAEDCAAEALVSVLRDDRHAGAGSAEAYMVTVARRRAVDFVRRRARERRRDDRLAAVAQLNDVDVAEAVADQAEAQWLAKQAQHSLTPPALAVLAELADGATVEQVATRLGLSRRSVESHLLRARRTLRGAVSATFAVVSWLVAAGRRTAVPATAAAAAVAAVVGISSAPNSPPSPRIAPAVLLHAAPAAPTAPHPQLPSAGLPVAQAPPVGTRTVALETPAAAVVPSPVRSSIATASSPIGRTAVELERTGDGRITPEDVTHCVQQLEVSLSHVGC